MMTLFKPLGIVVEKRNGYFVTDNGIKGWSMDSFEIGSEMLLSPEGDCRVKNIETKSKSKSKKDEGLLSEEVNNGN